MEYKDTLDVEWAIEDGEISCEYCGTTSENNLSAQDPYYNDETWEKIFSVWCFECDRDFDLE